MFFSALDRRIRQCVPVPAALKWKTKGTLMDLSNLSLSSFQPSRHHKQACCYSATSNLTNLRQSRGIATISVENAGRRRGESSGECNTGWKKYKRQKIYKQRVLSSYSTPQANPGELSDYPTHTLNSTVHLLSPFPKTIIILVGVTSITKWFHWALGCGKKPFCL